MHTQMNIPKEYQEMWDTKLEKYVRARLQMALNTN